MTMYRGAAALVALIALSGCKDKETESIPTDDTGEIVVIDTGGTDDTGETTADCEIALLETEPLYGNTSWYYRDALELTFDGDASKLAAVSVTDGNGEETSVSVAWDDSGFNATVTAAQGSWEGSTSYTLLIDICNTSSDVVFGTTSYGDALTTNPGSLIGNAYYIDMSRATYTKPAGVGAIMALYLSEPLLLGVLDATAEALSLMGAQGYIDDKSGDVLQDTDYETWDFGVADFTDSPFFAASGETIFEYDGIQIPVYSFAIEGTFSSDGTAIGGASFQGLGDTRNMGPLLQLGNDPGVTCELLEEYGLQCEACPDAEPFCLTIAGDFEDAVLLDEVALEVVSGG